MEPADSKQVPGSVHDTAVHPRKEDERSEDTIMMARQKKRFRMEETFPVIAAEEPPPVFHEDDKAAVVFENVYFYGSQDYLQMFRKEREQVLQNMTVKQVFLQYTVASGYGEDGLYRLVNALRGAMQDRVLKYYKAAFIKPSVEDCLDAKGTISLSVRDEKDLFRECKPCGIPTATKIWTDTSNRRNYKGDKKRSLPLGLVLGPSGSGKTFFALYELSRKFLVGSATRKRVTIYLQAKDVPVKFTAATGHNAAPAIVAWIKKCLVRDMHIVLPENIPLEMHMCIIIDEAGVAECKGWFEDKTMLCALCTAVKSLATSVAVVVVGTGLRGNSLSSSDDAFVFRMKPWQAKDVARILENYETSLKLVGEETPKFVAEAIFASSKLGALASNARSAFYLVQAIAQRSQYFSRLSWTYQLEDWTKGLVTQVVYEYMCSNRICNLSKPERRRVAASIFCAMRNSKPRDAQLLHLPGLNEKEITVGEALLQFNCENVNGKLKLVDDEPFAYTVTPAIAIVLYAMLGINAALNPGWKAEEEVAALFAVQQWVIDTMERYFSDGDRVNLDRSLEQVRVISLQKQVKSANSTNSILIPRVGPGAIVMNGDKAPFADVIAPYLLIQCKHDTSSSNMTTSVNLYDEMKKCSLLKKRECDTRVLRGLVEMWKGNLGPTGNLRNQSDQHQRRAGRNPQLSNAFPSNLLCLVPQIDPVEYAVIEGEHIIIGNKRRLLPPLDGTTAITFMVSTNLDQIHLTLSPRGDTITITEDNLDEDLQIKENLLDTSEQNRWKRFKRQVRDDVMIKFLLTKYV